MELWDSEDGQVKAIQWDHRTETVPAADNRISLYDLSGQFLGDVFAGRMELLGDLVILAQSDRAVIYNWAEERVIREDLANAWTWGSCLIGVPDNSNETLWILDREGQYRYAVLRENGETLIDDCLEASPGPGGMVVCKTETARGVLCRDGMWLYQEPIS